MLEKLEILEHAFHTDERRHIVDVTPRVKVYHVADRENVRLAGHYHARMEEHFYVIGGKLEFVVEHVDTKERKRYELLPGNSLVIPARYAHLALPAPNTQFLGIIDIDFDPKDFCKYSFDE